MNTTSMIEMSQQPLLVNDDNMSSVSQHQPGNRDVEAGGTLPTPRQWNQSGRLPV